MDRMKTLPAVSVVLPSRDEAAHIDACIRSVLEGDYEGPLELLVVDGMSADGTREKVCAVAALDSRVRLLDNPGRTVPVAMNIGIRRARGEVIVRVDAHTTYGPDYVRRCVEYLEETGADNVGGPMRVAHDTPFEEAVALATGSVFGVGNARFHFGDHEGFVDTVYLGAYRRDVFDRIGCYDESFVRNQDDELNLRLTRAGGRIYMTPKIRSLYRPRTSPAKLWRQYFQYGYYKAAVIRKHRVPASPRHLVPGAFVLSLALLPPLSAAHGPLIWAFAAVAASYAALSAAFTLRLCTGRRAAVWPMVPLVFGILHLGYGLGFLKGALVFFVTGSAVKRAYDVVLSAAGLAALMPLLLAIAAAVKLHDGGPVFFSQERVGRDFVPFRMLKFRTMRQGPAGEGPLVTASGDPRVTALGRFLRRHKLDELPQLVNVLKGEMSIVGPRPEVKKYVEAFSESYREVLKVRPGITDFASVEFRDEEVLLAGREDPEEFYISEVLPRKLKLGAQYAARAGPIEDARIILATLFAL